MWTWLLRQCNLVVMRVLSFLCFFAVLVLAACSSNIAPVNLYGQSEGPGSAGVHRVSDGETLWTISQRYNIVMRDIVYENDLAAPFKLAVGQRLILPPPREYQVRAGDSVSEVARIFDVSASELSRINDLRAPYVLRAGQVLRLPSPAGGRPQSVVTKPAPSAADDPVEVARVEAVDVERIESAPVGDVPKPLAKPDASVQEASLNSPPVAPRKPIAQKASVKKPKIKKRTKTPKRASSKFLNPVRGKVVSSYGSKKDGTHNDGINISAARGTAVKAAENGVVVYAGDGLKGSGNLILVRHADRWLTAYAHLDQITARNGAVVKRGQKIGTVGSTGAVRTPQLHFEVRRGTKALNPKPYLE